MGDEVWWRERFARHLVMSAIGEEGQRALGRTTVTVVGAGALGSNSAELLVRMGLGHVRLIDRDVVELSNLHRFRMLGQAHLGMSKAHALEEALTTLVPDASLTALDEDLTGSNALALLEGSDVVLDGLDNMEGRYVVNDACLELGIPWVYGGVMATTGMVAPFAPEGPCLRCLFPEPPEPGSLPTCESAGILPSAPAVVAAVQVAHAARLALGDPVSPRLLAMDLWTDDWRTIDLKPRRDCPACQVGARDFLGPEKGEMAVALCGQETVQINPSRRASIDMEAKEREWGAVGRVTRRGPLLMLELDGVTIHLFPSGRALVKGTSEVAVAKTLYARYVGH